MKLVHYDHDGRARFITFCTFRRIPILTNDLFRRPITDAIDEARAQWRFKLLAWVVMPDHVHLVIVPAVETKVGAVVGDIKRFAARNIHRLLSEGNSRLLLRLLVAKAGQERFMLWLPRCFDHNCRTFREIKEAIDYCHGNPVKKGFVKSPDAWRWSSYHWYEGAEEAILKLDAEPLH